MKEQKGKIWSKYFIIIMAAAFFTAMCMNMLDSTLSLLASDLWDSKTLGGYLTSVFNAGSIAMAFVSGRLVDKKGRRFCFLVAASCFAGATCVMAIWPVPAVALIVRFVQGIAKGLAMVAATSIVSDIIPKERLGEGMGLYGLGQTIPKALGPMVGLMIAASGNYTMMLVLCAVSYACAGLMVLGIDYEKKQGKSESTGKEELYDAGKYKGIWKLIEKKALAASINYTVFFFSTGIILVFMSVYARDILEIPTGQISVFYVTSAVVGTVVRLAFSKISDKYGALWMIIPGHIAQIISLVLLAFFSKGNLVAFYTAGALYGIGTSATMPTYNAVAVADSPKGRNGVANAAFYCIMDVGMLLASAILGNMIDAAESAAAGFRNAYLLSILVCVGSAVMSLICFNEKARERRRNS